MSLTLTIENMDRLDNGEPTQLKLDRHGAVIGRSPHSDWSLPDPKNYISSTHCEIDYRDGGYLLIDKSTNGTLINTGTSRIDGPHKLVDGDVIVIGHYRIVARTQGGAAKPAAAPGASKNGWGGWDDMPGSGAAAAPASSGWDTPGAPAPAAPPPSSWDSSPAPPAPAASGWDDAPATAPAANAWGAAPSAAPSPATSDSWGSAPVSGAGASPVWDPLSTGTGQSPSAWESAPSSAISGRGPMAGNWTPPAAASAAPAAAAPADDPWARFNASNTVDWARGGFDDATPTPAPAPAMAPAPAAPNPVALPLNGAPAPVAAPVAAAHPAASADAVWNAFVAASGVTPDLVKASPTDAAAAAGNLLKRLVAGLVVMMEARARAKSQLGAQSTTLELNGNNPLKFARTPDKVLAQLLNPPERGFMDANHAIEDSFQDLQAHQMATLAAMQGALRSTLERFSPEAIRARAETRGLLAKILPAARNAALWDAYQREFEGVARGSDEAFLDVFAKAFKAAYEQAAADMKRGAR